MRDILSAMDDMQRQYAAREMVELAARGAVDDHGRPLYLADEIAVARTFAPARHVAMVVIDGHEPISAEQRQWDEYHASRGWDQW